MNKPLPLRLLLCLLLLPCAASASVAPKGGQPALEASPATLLELAGRAGRLEPRRVAFAREGVPVLEAALGIEPKPGSTTPPLPDRDTLFKGLCESLSESARASEQACRGELQAQLGGMRSALGDHEGSLAAYREALKAVPERKRYLGDQALELFQLGRVEEADRTFEQAIEQAPDDAGVRQQAAFVALLRGQDARVLALLPAPPEPGKAGKKDHYFALYGWLASKRSGADPSAFLAARHFQPGSAAWPAALVEFVSGDGDEAPLVAQIGGGNPRDVHDRLCESLFFVGMRLEASGEDEAARSHYRAAVGTGVVDFLEHFGAEYRLAHPAPAP